MSQYFGVGDETVWNPSNGAARQFLRQVRLYEDELGVSSGLGPMESDECTIDPAALEGFVHALLDPRGRTRHDVIDALAEGVTATVPVLAERAGVEVRRPAREGGEAYEGLRGPFTMPARVARPGTAPRRVAAGPW